MSQHGHYVGKILHVKNENDTLEIQVGSDKPILALSVHAT